MGVLEVRLIDLHEPPKSRQKNEIASLIMARHHPELNVPPRNRTANSYRGRGSHLENYRSWIRPRVLSIDRSSLSVAPLSASSTVDA